MRSEAEWDVLLCTLGQNRANGYAGPFFCARPGCECGCREERCWQCGAPMVPPAVLSVA